MSKFQCLQKYMHKALGGVIRQTLDREQQTYLKVTKLSRHYTCVHQPLMVMRIQFTFHEIPIICYLVIAEETDGQPFGWTGVPTTPNYIYSLYSMFRQ